MALLISCEQHIGKVIFDGVRLDTTLNSESEHITSMPPSLLVKDLRLFLTRCQVQLILFYPVLMKRQTDQI